MLLDLTAVIKISIIVWSLIFILEISNIHAMSLGKAFSTILTVLCCANLTMVSQRSTASQWNGSSSVR